MMLWRHDLGDVPHHGLIRATGLKGLGTFTGFGTCSRFRWASVVGRAFSRAMPASGGGLATTRPHAWRRTRRRWGSTYPYLRRGSRVKQNLKRKPRSHVVAIENGAPKGLPPCGGIYRGFSIVPSGRLLRQAKSDLVQERAGLPNRRPVPWR